jgi:hypothetical protein
MNKLVIKQIEQVVLVLRPVTLTTGNGGGVTVHSALTGRGEPDQHPIGAITGLSGELEALNVNESEAAAILDADKVGFFSILGNVLRHITWANIITALTLLFVRKVIVFRTPINTASANVVADMADKWQDVDFPTDVTLTIPVGVMPVGVPATFEKVGAGEIIFVRGNVSTQAITAANKATSDNPYVQLLRKPDISGIEQYRVIGGVE